MSGLLFLVVTGAAFDIAVVDLSSTSMFAASVQPALVSLFSSTGSDPLALFATHTDTELPADSVVCLLEDASSTPVPMSPATLISPPALNHAVGADRERAEGYALSQTVLHLQSPTLRTTYVRSPPNPEHALGLKHPWVHLQVRNLGREWSFEAGIVDRAGREGVARFSTFQVLYLFFSPHDLLHNLECTPNALMTEVRLVEEDFSLLMLT